jgi:coenzyme F420-reducing hydrogenase beta subunit
MFRDDLQNEVLKVFAAKSLNKEQMLKSASGGIFPVLAENILEQDGVVFGCAYDENLVAKHMAIENLNELHKLQSSKYVQSDTLSTYTQVKNFLERERKVLYSGTPCQIAGLKAFCGKKYENLITVDLICRGVPSPKLFAEYIEWQNKKIGENVMEYNFRSKERIGWKSCLDSKTKTKTKTKYKTALLDPYFRAFLKDETLRECCYLCKYACGKRVGDITLADCWGIERIRPDFFSKNGVSLVLINTLNGESLWKNVQNKIESIQSSFEIAAMHQENLNKPAKRPIKRDSVYGMGEAFFRDSFSRRLDFLLMISMGFLKKFVPKKIKQKIKSVLKRK